MTSDGEVDNAAKHHGDLFFGVTMDGEHGAGLIAIPDEGLMLAVNGLARDASEGMLDGNGVPVDGRGPGWMRRAQNTNQPQKRASASRKKRTLETPPPKIR